MNKTYSIIFLCFYSFLSLAQKKAVNQQFFLDGTIKGNVNGSVYIGYLNAKGKFRVDSTRLENGHFRLTGFIKEPTLALLTTVKKSLPQDDDDAMKADGKNSILFFLEPKAIKADLQSLDFKNGQFTGSDSQMQLKEAMTSNSLHHFLDQHPESYVSAYLVSCSHFNLDSLTICYNRLPIAVKQSVYGKAIEEKIRKKEPVAIGNRAPQFTQKAMSGKAISLKDFKGKYLLLEFWSTSNSASRNENRNLVNAYNSFKNKNFTILSIALDGEKTRKVWQDAIEKDNLPWIQLTAKSSHNMAAIKYDVESLPSNFLIDPKGKIIATNLTSDKLNKELEKIIQ